MISGHDDITSCGLPVKHVLRVLKVTRAGNPARCFCFPSYSCRRSLKVFLDVCGDSRSPWRPDPTDHSPLFVPRVSTLRFFSTQQEALVPHSKLPLPCCPLDMTFDPEGRLWVLLDDGDAPLRVYTHTAESWEVNTHTHTCISMFHIFIHFCSHDTQIICSH